MNNRPQTDSFDADILPLALTGKNKLLAELLAAPTVRSVLLPHLRTVSFERNDVLYEQGDRIDSVYFPINCIVSNLAIMEDGTTIETSMVGHEGLIGISAILGSGLSRHWLWVSIKGTALQLETRFLDNVFLHNEDALKALLRVYRSMITQASQRCVCNTRHTVLERLCCWLLMVDDRTANSNLRLTQEMIASRLGARRAGITVAAGVLQELQAIEYRRGQLHITNRNVLEQTVCECYAMMEKEFNLLTPPPSLRLLAVEE